MKKYLLGLLILVVLVPVAGYLYLKSFLPDYNARITAPGLKRRVVVKRNRYAVPSIEASRNDDLYFAWGFVNAQDRMFQLEVTRRIGQGRISEFAGPSMLKKDIFLRAVGFYDLAQKEAARLGSRHKRFLKRYVDGINYYLETHQTPLYMRLLGLKKEKWTLADPIVVGLMLNWSLAYNMKHELLYYKISRRIGRHKLKELLNLAPEDTPTIINHKLARSLDQAGVLAFFKDLGDLMGCRSASNNWVIAPNKTTSSGPILANDPHVHGSKIPSDFYLVRVKAGRYEAAGGQVAGLPFIAFGYNQKIAWGITNNGADIIDVFIERVNFEKKTYIRGGRDLPLRSKTVEIKVKGQEPVKKTLYWAGRRPLLNEVFPELKRPISIDWTGFDGVSIKGFFDLNRARNYAQFVRAANKIRMTPQNMVYADAKGNIAYRLIGSLPVRKPGTGNLPGLGAITESNWEGYLSRKKIPRLLNPARGHIITANNKTAADLPCEMNAVYAPRYRYEAIARMIEVRGRFDLDDIKDMQTDTYSVLADKIIPLMKKYVRLGQDLQAHKAMALVTDWDRRVEKESPAPSIYNTFLVRFMYETLVDELGPDLAEEYVSQRYISLERFLDLIEKKSVFFDDVSTSKKETVRDIATYAFGQTLKILSEYYASEDPAAWVWGRIHVIRFDHFLGKSKLLRSFVNYGPLPLQGDGETNLRAHFYEIRPPYTAALAAGMRLIVRFDPEPQGELVLITGQNEFFLSPHYTDMTHLWMKGEYFSVEKSETKYQTVFTPQ